mmetsp:Transcript_30408/g.50509  ORF Transcript_30408/g.50509 Transcript_30408/m.50509 type:complete len:95 (+) Transcript_30408:122-406(+)
MEGEKNEASPRTMMKSSGELAQDINDDSAFGVENSFGTTTTTTTTVPKQTIATCYVLSLSTLLSTQHRTIYQHYLLLSNRSSSITNDIRVRFII